MATRKAKVNRAATVAAFRRMGSGGPPTNTPRDSGQRAASYAQALRQSPSEAKAHNVAVKKASQGKSGGGGGGGLSLGSVLDVVKGAGGKALEALDVGRAYSVSGLKELHDLVQSGTRAIGLPDQAGEGALSIGARGIGGGLKLASGDSKGAKQLLTKQEKPSDPSLN